jgi:hypothetical protein
VLGDAKAVEEVREAEAPEPKIVSSEGTNTSSSTARRSVVTELRAATYARMDTSRSPFVPSFTPGNRGAGQSLAGTRLRVVLDCGS